MYWSFEGAFYDHFLVPGSHEANALRTHKYLKSPSRLLIGPWGKTDWGILAWEGIISQYPMGTLDWKKIEGPN